MRPFRQPDTLLRNPAKSWKMALLLVPILVAGAFMFYHAEDGVTTKAPQPVRTPSAADGKVHVVGPQSEVDSVLWDGEMRWHPYPNAASYEVHLFRDPAQVLWKETSSSDHLRAHTESFPRTLNFYLNHAASVGYRILARDSKGNVIADSGPVYFYLSVHPQSQFASQ